MGSAWKPGRTVRPLAHTVLLTAASFASFAAPMVDVDPRGSTVLMADRADRSKALRPKLVWDERPWGRAWVENWTSPAEYLRWQVRAPAPGSYEIDVLVFGQSGRRAVVIGPSNRLEFTMPASQWWRVRVSGALRIPAGTSLITLKLLDPGTTQIKSLELVNAAERGSLERRIQAARSPTAWLSKSGYGLMVQWGEWVYPPHGPKKQWPKMIDDFDVDRFARMVEETGAAYVIWSVTWSTFYYPAPSRAIDRLLAGRTSRRDLIGELADALSARGVRLMLYYHLGWPEKEWWDRNWDSADTEKKEKFTANLCSILEEAGMRYRLKLAGWFIDDGMALYPAPFERITQAAKAGNPARLVAYNPWLLPKLTDFQDVFFGESFRGSDDTPPDGKFVGGPQAGLFAHGMFILDGPDWGIAKPDYRIRQPIPAEALIGTVRRAMDHGQALSLNVLMFEDGSVSPDSLAVLKQLRAAVRGPGRPARKK